MNQEHKPLWSDDTICEELGATSDAHVDYASSFAIGLDVALKVMKAMRDDYEALRQPPAESSTTVGTAQPDANGLLPCPFCGCPANIEGDGLGGTMIWCDNQECPVDVEYNHHIGREEAMTEWNRRAPQPPMPSVPLDVLEALEFALEFAEIGIGYDEDDPRLQTVRAWLAAQPPAQGTQLEPDWSQAPEWAQWWSVDPTGFTMWYEEEPILYQTVTFCGWGAKVIRGIEQGMKLGDVEVEIPFGIDWRQTLHRRPSAQPTPQA